MTDIYDKLRARLDDMATGFPETESKIEIKLLQRAAVVKKATEPGCGSAEQLFCPGGRRTVHRMRNLSGTLPDGSH